MSTALPKPNTPNQTKRVTPRLWSFLWRGAVGGAIVPLIRGLFYMYRVPYARVFLLAFLILLCIPAAYGAFIGGMLWLTVKKRGERLNLITRAVLGMAIAMVFCLPYIYFFELNDSLIMGGLFRTLLLNSLLTGLVIGLPAGVFAPSGSRSRKDGREPVRA